MLHSAFSDSIYALKASNNFDFPLRRLAYLDIDYDLLISLAPILSLIVYANYIKSISHNQHFINIG